jgi:lysophospholipase L1-like esterase
MFLRNDTPKTNHIKATMKPNYYVNKLLLPALLIGGATGMSFAHTNEPAPLLTVYAVDPTNPQVSYDEDPYVYSPAVSENPTVVYPSGGAPTPSTPPGPGVITSDAPPDSHTPNRSDWNRYVYYDLPSESATVANGPYLSSGVPMKFDFGTASSPVQPGYTRVHPGTLYSASTGYGWGKTGADSRDRGATGTGSGEESLERDFCLVNAGNAFYVDVPNGKYRVSLLVGDKIVKSGITVRADGVPVVPGMGAAISNWSRVSVLYESGKEAVSSTRVGRDGLPFPMQKSGRIRFEFIASTAHINALTIEPVSDATWNAKPVIYTASDSTVASYGLSPSSGPFPTGLTLMGWGEPLHNHFDSGILIDNQALAGRSSRSFAEEGVLDAILNRIKPGDYFFVMFAINDSADVIPTADDPDPYNNRDTKAETTHKAWTRIYINETRKRGGIPVLVTSQIKMTYDANGQYNNSVQGYPQADRELGWEMGVPVVDLNKESIDYLTALGPAPDDGDPTTQQYPLGNFWYRSNPDGSKNDYIHLCPYGANQYARLVSRLVQKTPGLEALAAHVIAPTLPQPGLSVRSSY